MAEVALRQPRGRYFEDFQVGDRVVTAGRTITETDVVLFAGISGDYNPLHTDAEYARTMMFGERVAHGLLGLAVASGLAMQLGFLEGTVEAFTGLEWKFKAPIRLGDTIHVEAEVAQRRPLGQGGLIVFNMAVINQRGETVQKGQWTVLVRGRPAPAAGTSSG